ncbi:aromatic ring-hydroxylating dioxygenase subunit alpha [Novosphingobium sp. KCTC 2891]|uniref:aromatic ring-hydroxylating oxygenase subunit alpha n=1 Tax=Novosphingobium sp. KCTC 2891 TaxID=2989730 RepID=UPI00222389C7|nr:aromatic ring-hydroxylating dioxygenase subunit alpha [Novosphingobium sp. KCTC 2891]MCW1384699.1 aromatic ring-hydroxylating dioxygenase subunit alpha [Novosphingobium sp. KCTC 2891]
MDGRQRLIDDAQEMLRRLEAKTITPAPGQMRLPSSAYVDPDLFELEKRNLFRRVPLMLAASCELRAAGDYKTMEIAGIPLLLVRGKDGQVRTFLNACTHRGSKLARDCGRSTRFTCPYHAWSFGLDGGLIGVAAREVFGDVDAEASHLVTFPTTERAGLVWAILDPAAPPAFDVFLAGFDTLLQGFSFEKWHYFESRHLKGANWKLAFDAHLDFYHLPVLHRETFGAKISNLAEYFYYGPHQRLGLVTQADHVLEQDDLPSLAGRPQEEWPLDTLLFGEWIIFPNVSINCFYKGGRGVIISQILPGAAVGESVTVQIFLHEQPPEGQQIADAREMSDFLGHVVGEEDLPMSLAQQQVFASGLLPEVQFGRNEGGIQHFHHWLERFVDAPAGAPLEGIMAGGRAGKVVGPAGFEPAT